jgi:hypothetical protein
MPKTLDSASQSLPSLLFKYRKIFVSNSSSITALTALADHLLNVVRFSNARLVLAAPRECNGGRVSQIKHEDEHVFNFLRNTFRGRNYGRQKLKVVRAAKKDCVKKIVVAHRTPSHSDRKSIWLVGGPSCPKCACG